MNADDYKKAFEAVLLRLARCEVRLNCVEEAGLVQKPPAPAPAKEQEEELEPVVKKAMAALRRNLFMFNPGMANMQGMMKKVQKMQQDMLKMQEELKNRTVEATAGGGAVTVVVTGRKTVEKVTIAPSAVDPEDVEMLEDLVTTAINEAMRKVDEMTEKEMGKITGGMKLPGMF